MATQTARLKLVKPSLSEAADISVINENMNKLDAAFALAGSPANLLDNSNFSNFVNQRGNDSSSASWLYDGIDRWVNLGSTASTTWHNSDHVALGAFRGIAQVIADKNRFVSKTYTLACKTHEYGVQCVSGVFDGLTGPDSGQDAPFRMYMCGWADDDRAYIRFENNVSTPENYVHIYWAALYEGEYTLDTLPAYQPKGYAAELAECKLYFERLYKHFLVKGDTDMYLTVNYADKRLSSPTLTANTDLSDNVTVNIAFWDTKHNGASGLIGSVQSPANQAHWYGYIDISADL